MVALKIRDDLTADELRRWARGEARGRPAARAYAISNGLDGMSRAEAARAAGMERQALRDAVVRYNTEGVAGLYDRPKGHPPPRLTAAERAALADVVERGPDPERDGVSAWTRGDLCRWLEASFAKSYHPSSMSRVLRGLGMSRQKIRPSHPEKDPEAEESFKKGGSARR
jgi:transposase